MARSIYRLGVRPLLAAAAAIGAIVVVVDAYPRAHDSLFWRDREYNRLSQLHAGYDIAYGKSLLGIPTITKTLAETQYKELIYVRREHYVQLVTDPSGRIVLYSVTSCNPDFDPSFQASSSVSIALQQEPMSKMLSNREGKGSHFEADLRQLEYQPGSTVSTPQTYWESTGFSSNASRGRVWFLGVNPLCVSDRQYELLPSERYSGSVQHAPFSAHQFRATFAANTYAETIDLLPTIDDLSMILLAPPGKDDSTCLDADGREPGAERCGRVTLGTFWFDIPELQEGETRVFDSK
ncbi:MAG: ETEC_3214 domain-containing protein [Phycicoccus sp.]